MADNFGFAQVDQEGNPGPEIEEQPISRIDGSFHYFIPVDSDLPPSFPIQRTMCADLRELIQFTEPKRIAILSVVDPVDLQIAMRYAGSLNIQPARLFGVPGEPRDAQFESAMWDVPRVSFEQLRLALQTIAGTQEHDIHAVERHQLNNARKTSMHTTSDKVVEVEPEPEG